MESFSTHKCRETGFDFNGGSWERRKKSLSKRKGALARGETHTPLPVLAILKGSVIFFFFFLHKYAHLGRFSPRSPRPSVFKASE